MFSPLILAESSSLSSLIHFLELLISTTAIPALIGLLVLFRNHFRAPGATLALFLGLLTALLAGALCGWVWWEDATWEWYKVMGPSLFTGLLVCALAWWSRRRG